MTPAKLCRMAAERIGERSCRTSQEAMLWPYPEAFGLSTAPMPPQKAWAPAVRARYALFPEIDNDPSSYREARILALLLLGEVLEEET